MREILFSIGPLHVYSYGAMIALGVLAAYGMAEYRARKQGLPFEHIFSLVMWCLIGGMVSSKLLFWITEWKLILEDPGFLLRSLGDGFVVYGGIIGGILAGYVYCRRNRLAFLQFFDLVVPSVALAQGFGRIGCLLAGCCYGKETDSVFSITFSSSSYAPNGIPLIPTQIYSSFLDFFHCMALLWIARHKKAEGQVAACYLILYSVGRFVLEFFRGDLERGSVGALSTSQFISIFTAAAGIAIFFLPVERQRRNSRKI